MHISCEWFDGKFPSFTVALHSSKESEAFIQIRGCRIVDGKNGKFVSWPSRKQDNGKYWNHVICSEKFAYVVLEEAEKSKPTATQAKNAEYGNDDVPF